MKREWGRKSILTFGALFHRWLIGRNIGRRGLGRCFGLRRPSPVLAPGGSEDSVGFVEIDLEGTVVLAGLRFGF